LNVWHKLADVDTIDDPLLRQLVANKRASRNWSFVSTLRSLGHGYGYFLEETSSSCTAATSASPHSATAESAHTTTLLLFTVISPC